MNSNIGATTAGRPLLDLDAMAAIVQELIAGGEARQRDKQWLLARVKQAGLTSHAAVALEAVRDKLCQGGALLSGDGTSIWG